MSVLMSAPGPLVVGLGLLAGRSATQLADFFRRSSELLAIIIAFITYQLTAGKPEDGRKERIQKLSNLFDPPVLRGEKPADNLAERASEILREIDAFAPVIGRNLLLEEYCHQRSWDILQFHAGLCRYLAEVLLGIADGQIDEAKSHWSKLRRFARVNEMKYQAVFDMPLFLSVWESQVLPVLCETNWRE